jgi:hypothetical protein
MRKILKQLVVFLLALHLILSFNMAVASAVTTPLESIKIIGEGVDKETEFPNFDDTGLHPDAPPDFAQEGVVTVTSPILFAIDMIRLVVSSIAFLVVVFAAIKLISTANDEEAKKAKDTLLVGAIGLLVIQLASVAVNNMFFGQQGEILEDVSSAKTFAEESVTIIRGIIGFVEAFVGIAAVLTLVIRGFVVLTSGGDEDQITTAKRHVIYAIVGLVAVALAEVIVRGVIFPQAGEVLPDVQRGRYIIVTLTNYIAGFISIFAFLTLFYAGYKYVVSAGNEEVTEEVKKIFIGSTIALILALGAFALVNTLIAFEPEYVDNIDNQLELVE